MIRNKRRRSFGFWLPFSDEIDFDRHEWLTFNQSAICVSLQPRIESDHRRSWYYFLPSEEFCDWINDASDSWFCIRVGKSRDSDGIEVVARFADPNDAFEFKLRWSGVL